MHPVLNQVRDGLDVLVKALDGHDATEIATATEKMAASVVELSELHIPSGQEALAQMLITKTLAQMDAASIRINMLKAWTRQRIDRNQQIRGIRYRGMALSY